MKHSGIYICGSMGSGRDIVAQVIKTRFTALDSNLVITIKRADNLILNDIDPTLTNDIKMRKIRDGRDTLKLIYGENYWNNKLISANGGFQIISDGSGITNLDYWRSKNFCCIGVFAKESIRIPQIIEEYGFEPTIEDLRHKIELESIYSATNLTDYSLENIDTIENLRTKSRQLATTIFNLLPDPI